MFKMMSLISLLLSGIMFLSGCAMTVQAPGPEVIEPSEPVIEEPVETPKLPEVSGGLEMKEVGFNSFDSSLISFIDKDFSRENYMLSPLSFKYALGLAVLGAGGETEKELYNALGFTDFSDFEKLIGRIDDTKEEFEIYNGSLKDMKWLKDEEKDGMKIYLDIANSVWDISGNMKDSYIDEVKSKMGAEAKKTSLSTVVAEVNTWVNEKTRGLIPQLLNSPPDSLGAVLVNTVYLKSSWFESFNVTSEPLKFTDIDGNKVDKESINRQDKFAYFKDKDTEIVVVPLNGGVSIAYVIGDNENIFDKLNKATIDKEVLVEVPKIDIETSFDKKEFVNYLISMGVKEAFLGTADFDKMSEDMFIGDIIQKTKIKTDENGLEAAAATAIMMKENAIAFEPEKPIEFIADRPFSFYIFTDVDNTPDLLFYGNYVR